MKTFTMTESISKGCVKQEVIQTQDGDRWRWTGGGCPFAQEDVSDACLLCGHLVETGRAASTSGPDDSGVEKLEA